MRFRAPWILLVLLLLVSTSAAAQTFTATLLGTNEPPPCDLDGTGSAIITFVGGTTVNYTIVVNNIILPPIAQHIHIGPAGVNGPVVIGLPGVWVGNTLVGSTPAAPATIAAIIADPGAYYVNVHTTDCPGGAVRGQLAAVVEPAVPTVSTWGLIAIALVLAIAGMFVVKNV